MLIWKPFSFYPSSQILSKKYLIFSENKKILKYFVGARKIIISISGLRIHILNISDEFKYIYIFNLFEKYFRKTIDEIFPTKIFRRNIYDENIWRII